MTWKPIGAELPTMLVGARVELHWAIQAVSAPGATWLEPRADHSNTNLGWDDAVGMLVGRTVGAERLRAGLVFESLELVVLEGERERATLALAGRRMVDALEFLEEHMSSDEPKEALSRPEHSMPPHEVAGGGAFAAGDSSERAELSLWFEDASGAIHQAVIDESNASIVRCWPHHFDVASLVVLDAEADAEEARSIGVGFSPGDESYAQPYFYVNPWPYPSANALPTLEGKARWHTEGWIGAVLTGEQILSAGEDRQGEFVERELQRAIAACHVALGR